MLIPAGNAAARPGGGRSRERRGGDPGGAADHGSQMARRFSEGRDPGRSGDAGKLAGADRARLGDAPVTGSEDLDLLFREDYHARNIFVFLRVKTLKELEQYSAGEMLRRLIHPIKETVERIRRFLAERNRCLAGDEEFALEIKSRSKENAG